MPATSGMPATAGLPATAGIPATAVNQARATLGTVHQQQQDMPQEHGRQHQGNTKTTTGNIRDATNIMDASNSKEATAGTPLKAV